MRTINEVIEALQSLKEAHGGETDITVALHCQGNADYVEIENITSSKIFGVRFEVSPPWWMYKKYKKAAQSAEKEN